MGLIQAQGLPLPEPEQRPAEYTAADLMQLLRDPEFEMLVGETERSLGKKLTTMDLKRLANLRHEVGLPADVIFLAGAPLCGGAGAAVRSGAPAHGGQPEKEGYYWAKRGLFDQESAARYLRTVARPARTIGAVHGRPAHG